MKRNNVIFIKIANSIRGIAGVIFGTNYEYFNADSQKLSAIPVRVNKHN